MYKKLTTGAPLGPPCCGMYVPVVDMDVAKDIFATAHEHLSPARLGSLHALVIRMLS
jgi:hypothetical protein